MIYVCIPSYNEAPTLGLLLWKIRQVFTAFPREYQLIVCDDGSTDATSELLEPYARVLPLTVLRHPERRGYAVAVEAMLRCAVERTDRPKRDCAIVMHADFTHDAQHIPDFVRRIDSGADMVVAEGRIEGRVPRAYRWLRRLAPRLFRGKVGLAEVSDPLGGFLAFRLIVLRNAFRGNPEPLLTTDGWAANAELLGYAGRHARRVESFEAVERHDLHQRPSRVAPWNMALALWRTSRSLRLRPPHSEPVEAPAHREPTTVAP